MAITVKKSSAPKTLRVAPRAGASEAAPAAVSAETGGSISFDTPKKRSYTADIVIGIIACLVFGALITIQAIEWKFYEQPPQRAFPVFQAQGTLTLAQKWAAAPMGIQVGIILGVIMLIISLVSIIMSVIKSMKAKSEAIA